MAGRSSTTITAGRAAKLFTNTTGKPVVVTINATSADNTTNPKINLKIDNNSNHTLNYAKVFGTLPSGFLNTTAAEFDFASASVGYGQNVIGLNGGTSGGTMTFNNTVATTNVQRGRWTTIEPYLLDNPAAYGKKTARYAVRHSSSFYLKDDITKQKEQITNWIQTSGHLGNNVVEQGFSYGDAGAISCPYTDVCMFTHTNAYGGLGYFYNNTSSDFTTRTSDWAYYQASGSSYNPNSYWQNDPKRMAWQADYGIICQGGFPNSTSSTDDRLLWHDTRWRGSPMGGGAEDGASGVSAGTAAGHNSGYFSYMNMNNIKMHWFKYNPTAKKFYCLVTGSGTDSGIYSFEKDALFPQTSGLQQINFGDITTLENSSDLIVPSTQPMRIGASVWVCFTGTSADSALYSSDLKTWKPAHEYLGLANSEVNLISVNNSLTYYADGTNLTATTSGYSDIPNEGTLELGTAVGVYERNGIVLNNGDSLYGENIDTATALYTTVMYVEV